jgi:Zn-dependent protease/CBS domain-containing protein
MNGGLRGVRIGRVLGIDLAIDQSWLIIAVLMTWSLTLGFQRWHPAWTFAACVATAALAAVLFFVSVVLHELAHSVVARSFGVPVHRITLFLFGGVSNIEREPPSAKAEFLTAVVGPLTSIVLGLVLIAIASRAAGLPADAAADPYRALSSLGPAATLLLWLGPINIIVGLFNLVPGFPLDGGRILRAAIWGITGDLHRATRIASACGQAIGWLFVLLGVAMVFGASVPFFGRGLVPGLWLAFIGWFLTSAAAQSYKRLVVHEILEGLTVSRLMRPPGAVVPTTASVEALVHDWLMRTEERAFPVVADERRLVGLVTLSDVRRARREAWPEAPVTSIMTPAADLIVASPREDLAEALDKLARADVSQLPVVEEDRLVGVLYRRDVARWIELHVHPQTRRYAH